MSRRKQLIDWIGQFHGSFLLESASSDASFRSYERITLPEGRTMIAMNAPPKQENLERFIQLAQAMKMQDLSTPDIFHFDLDQGFALIEDLGSITLQNHLAGIDDRRAWIVNAVDELMVAQKASSIINPILSAYDEALLNSELSLFSEWLVKRYLKQPLYSGYDKLARQLVQSALGQPQVFVHRDYHSRNLMVTAQNELAVIDFQDAVIGPITYDLVSLLRDCYVVYSDEDVQFGVNHYLTQARDENIWGGESDVFERYFDLMGMQRHLKAAGIFARLHLRDGKDHYLRDIPTTLRYLSRVSRRYPEYQAFAVYVEEKIMPALQAKLVER